MLSFGLYWGALPQEQRQLTRILAKESETHHMRYLKQSRSFTLSVLAAVISLVLAILPFFFQASTLVVIVFVLLAVTIFTLSALGAFFSAQDSERAQKAQEEANYFFWTRTPEGRIESALRQAPPTF
jgi:fatty-acid desaturase